ncbi:hypothetical protein Taro_017667 [Colocasia esculenta]|uniref:DUF4283 domain-containing protein n=1 Tax=Colocasia esculenta TaxID=4460 RepID=A0A843UGR3_COLES|nr:hypothetical protein [Colocasia esculenta]
MYEWYDGSILASISIDVDLVSASTLWTPTLTPASSDVDANFSDLHALQSRKFRKQATPTIGELSPRLIRPPAASRSLLDHRGRHPQPQIALELAQEPGGRPSWRLVGNFLGQPKESFTKPFDPFGVYLKGKYPTHSVHSRIPCRRQHRWPSTTGWRQSPWTLTQTGVHLPGRLHEVGGLIAGRQQGLPGHATNPRFQPTCTILSAMQRMNIVNVTVEHSSFCRPKKEKLEPHLRPLREATTTTWSKYFLGHRESTKVNQQSIIANERPVTFASTRRTSTIDSGDTAGGQTDHPQGGLLLLLLPPPASPAAVPTPGTTPAASSIPTPTTTPSIGAWGTPAGAPTFAQVLLKSIKPPVVPVQVHAPATTDAGEPAVFFSPKEVKLSCKPLDLAIIEKTPQGRPPFQDIRTHLTQRFQLQEDFLISAYDGRHIIITFRNEKDYYKVLLKESMFVHGRIFRFSKWTMEFSPNKDSPVVPVWLHMPGLPANFFSEPMIRSIAGSIGPVLQIDQNTSRMIRADAAVVCVQLDVSKKLPDRVWVGVGGGGSWQPIVYPAPPLFCTSCSRLGHSTKNCRQTASEKTDNMAQSAQEDNTQPSVKATTWRPFRTINEGIQPSVKATTLHPVGGAGTTAVSALVPSAAAAPACEPSAVAAPAREVPARDQPSATAAHACDHATSPSAELPSVPAFQGNPNSLGESPVVCGNASKFSDPWKEALPSRSPAGDFGAQIIPSQEDFPPSEISASCHDHGTPGMLGPLMGLPNQAVLDDVESHIQVSKESVAVQQHTRDVPEASDLHKSSEMIVLDSTPVQTGQHVQVIEATVDTPLTFAQVVRQPPKSPNVLDKWNQGECSNTRSSGSSSGRRKNISRPSRKGGVRISLPIVRDRSRSPVRQLEEINTLDLSLQDNIKDWRTKISSVFELARAENIFMPGFKFDSEVSGMDSEEDYMDRCSQRPGYDLGQSFDVLTPGIELIWSSS